MERNWARLSKKREIKLTGFDPISLKRDVILESMKLTYKRQTVSQAELLKRYCCVYKY